MEPILWIFHKEKETQHRILIRCKISIDNVLILLLMAHFQGSSFSGKSSSFSNTNFCTCGLWSDSGYNQTFKWKKQPTNFYPKFSGLGMGDITKVTVLEEMTTLKMALSEPIDLSDKPLNFAKKKKT